MSEEVRSVLIGTAGLGAAALVALLLTLTRGPIERSPEPLRAAVRLVAGVIACQSLHFVEELATGFHVRFPELLGLPAWPLGFFVTFNLSWIAIWGISAAGLAAARRWALFPLWFLAIACAMNGLAHPLFSAVVGGYFPGLITSPLVGIAGVRLLGRLSRLTGVQPAVPRTV